MPPLVLMRSIVAALDSTPLPRCSMMSSHSQAISFALVPGAVEATLPFTPTSSAVSGTPAYVEDRDSVRDAEEPDIAAGMPVYDSLGQHVGNVESISFDPATDKITWIAVKRGHLFAREATIPASVIQSVTDRVTLNAPAQSLRRLETAGA